MVAGYLCSRSPAPVQGVVVAAAVALARAVAEVPMELAMLVALVVAFVPCLAGGRGLGGPTSSLRGTPLLPVL